MIGSKMSRVAAMIAPTRMALTTDRLWSFGMPNSRACRRLAGNVSVGFDLDAPLWVEQRGDDHHGGLRGRMMPKYLPWMSPTISQSSARVRYNPGAVDVLDGAASLLDSCSDDGEALVGLSGYIGFIGADWAGAGDVDMVADADGAGEADDGLEGAGSGDVCAGHRKVECRSM